MSKSYRIRTKLGTDQNIRVNIEQDFDFLEILSLKLRQEDVYAQFCADYGVVVGRVVANSGFGIPNARVSVFVPVEDMDLENPVISALYPYKGPSEKNEDGYRYNLLPYEKQYGGHTPTGTFPSREDVLTRNEVLEIYEKYYKFTVKTNDSGDFMITGVPLGNQKLVLDMDLSDMGCFSLRPQDLIRMNMGVQSQFDGQNFKASSNLDELPQIINQVKDIDVTSFWGQEDLCNIGITRVDFDLRELGIEIQPTAVFMGSVFTDADTKPVKTNCKPRTEQGDMCGLATGPGEILAVRQTIDIDDNGDPILEQFNLENAGKVIDENGTFVTDVPMNLDYVVTNEFGEVVISNDPTIGVPTKGKYRFKIKYQSEENGPPYDGVQFFPIRGEIQRANFVVPQIREYGWDGVIQNSGVDPSTKGATTITNVNFFNQTQIIETQTITVAAGKSVYVKPNSDAELVEALVNNVVQTQHWIDFPNGGTLTIRVSKKSVQVNNVNLGNNVTIEVETFDYDFVQFQKSYAFSLDWGDYADKGAAISCDDSFYEMNYNKVYTPSQMVDEYRNGYGRARFLGIKEILDRGCENDTNKFPANDGVRNFDLLFFIVNIVMTLFMPILFVITVVGHVVCTLYKYLRWLLDLILKVILTVIIVLCYVVKALTFGLFRRPCPDYQSVKLPKNCPIPAIPLPNISYPECQACSCESKQAGEPEGDDLPEIVENTSILVDTTDYTFFNELVGVRNEEIEQWQKFQYGFQMTMSGNDVYGSGSDFARTPFLKGKDNPMTNRETWSYDLPLSERFNLFNAKANYHHLPNGATNRIKVKVNPSINNTFHTDNVMMLVVDSGVASSFQAGEIVTFQDINKSLDPNVNSTTGSTIFTTGQGGGQKNITVTYMDTNTNTQTTSYIITGDTSFTTYDFPSDVEYYQVITGNTLSEFENLCSINGRGTDKYGDSVNKTLGRFHIFGWQHVKKTAYLTNPNPEEYPWRFNNTPYRKPDTGGNDWFEKNVPNIKLNGDWENLGVIFLVRGVDVHTPRQVIEYDLSYLYGYGAFNGSVKVTGNYLLNIPIQPYGAASDWRLPIHLNYGNNNNTSLNQRIFYNSYSFTPSNADYQSYKTKNHQYYSAYGANNRYDIGNVVGGSNVPLNSPNVIDVVNQAAAITTGGLGTWREMVEDNQGVGELESLYNYDKGQVLEGVGVMISKNKENYYYYSKTYQMANSSHEINMINNQKIVMRTDRLPTSDITQNRMVLHQNKAFAIYTLNDDGTTSESFNVGLDVIGDGADDFNEDAGAIATQINQTFSCEGMVPLECYSGNGETIGVLPKDDRCYYLSDKKEIEKLQGGCYYLLLKNFAIREDFQSIAEWRSRFRMMFGLCNNVLSLTFVNNWINGSLYMFAFQKNNIYSNNINDTKFLTNPDYVYCEDTIVYQTQTNSFFYRASPYNSSNPVGFRFIGRDNTPLVNIIGRPNGANKKFLGNPTTIMDMGPRDLFTKEICYNPDFQGYIIDKVSSTSYKDTSDLIQLFAISRLTASGFWEQIIGFGDGSIQKLFSRDNQRLDADISQLISINSEFGVVPYLGTNYSDSQIRYIGEQRVLPNGRTVYDPVLGVFFSADTVSRDMISPGRFTFQDTVTQYLSDNYGHTDQEVPYHKWEIISSGSTIFGLQVNDWYSKKSQDGIGSFNYQSVDRMNATDTFNTNVSMPSSERPGYIYNSNIVGNQIEVTPNKPNPMKNRFNAGSPYFFYFGLKKGASSMNRYIDKFIFNQETL